MRRELMPKLAEACVESGSGLWMHLEERRPRRQRPVALARRLASCSRRRFVVAGKEERKCVGARRALADGSNRAVRDAREITEKKLGVCRSETGLDDFFEVSDDFPAELFVDFSAFLEAELCMDKVSVLADFMGFLAFIHPGRFSDNLDVVDVFLEIFFLTLFGFEVVHVFNLA